MRGKESEYRREPYWQHDLALDLTETSPHPGVAFRLRVHESLEQYSRAGGLEIVPLTYSRGTRRYFQGKPYVREQDLMVKVGVFPELSKTGAAEGAIGRVTDSYWTGLRHRDIGLAQAWFYPADATVVLWECLLDDRYQSLPPSEDALFSAFWQNWEQFVLTRCPGTERIVTPAWEPLYEQEHWQEFLAAQGYRPFNTPAFMKDVASR